MAFLTEDRKESGCFLLWTVMANMQVAVCGTISCEPASSARGDQGSLRGAEASLRVRTPDLEEPVLNLSAAINRKFSSRGCWMTHPRSSFSTRRLAESTSAPKPRFIGSISELAAKGVAVLMIRRIAGGAGHERSRAGHA